MRLFPSRQNLPESQVCKTFWFVIFHMLQSTTFIKVREKQ